MVDLGLISTLFKSNGNGATKAGAARSATPWTGGIDEFAFGVSDRRDAYEQNEALLNGDFYDTQDGKFRKLVLNEVFGIDVSTLTDAAANQYRLLPWWNPIPAVVGLYQRVLPGLWGQGIRVAEKVSGDPVNPAFLAEGGKNPLSRLWKMSNLDTNKEAMIEMAANLGCVGIRIVASNEPGQEKKVALQFDHPGQILDFNTNAEGHVTEIELFYTTIGGPLGNRRTDVEIREIFTKDEFFQSIDGIETRRPNELGVCPYVILRHGGVGKSYGRWAYKGGERLMHIINWLVSNLGDSIYENVWPTWFATAGGNKPEIFSTGRKNVAYVKTNPDTPPPSLAALVAQLDFTGAVEFLTMIMQSSVVKQMPEVLISEIKALAGQSGETIAKLQIPAEAAIEQAKPNYDDGLIRALKIGLSEGIRLSMWDLGTGVGTREAADRAFRQGKEEFAFADRPALPQTVYDKLQQSKVEDAEKMSGVNLANAAAKLPISEREQLRLAGYDDKQIDEIRAEIATEDVIPETDAGDGGANNGSGTAAT